MAEDYTNLPGYVADADFGLGCGIPTEFARIQTGQTVLDLGSGAGNDAFVARRLVGDAGRVIGVDMTEAMIARANKNLAKVGFTNMEFRLGEIEDLPVDSDSVDVVISNCVLNLVPDKGRAFGEINRVLKPGGHFAISDIVLRGELPPELKEAAVMYTGCVAGAMQIHDYLDVIHRAGFRNVHIGREKRIILPDELLAHFLSDEKRKAFLSSDVAILSITIYGDK
jgi:SAM-dependent methyltransferase